MKLTEEQKQLLISKFEAIDNISDRNFENFLEYKTESIGAFISNLVDPTKFFEVAKRPNLIIDSIATTYCLTESEIRTSKTHEAARFRAVAIYCLKRYQGLTRRQIARLFGMSQSGVAKAVRKVQKRLETDWWFCEDMKIFEDEIPKLQFDT